MKKVLGTIATVALMSFGAQAFADESLEVGEKIYKQAFGRGCGSCHDVKSNPQLAELIKAGTLDLHKFTSVVKEGKNGMPKAVDAIMAVGAVKKAGLSEDEAIAAVFKFLGK